MLFVGTYEHTIDAKNRLAVPREVRQQINPKRDGKALYAVIMEGQTLCLYTERGFEKRSEQLDESTRSAEEVLLYEQMLYSMAQRVELDKQGRVRLPERLVKLAKLDREVVVIGVKDHLQVHDRTTWQENFQKMLSTRPDLLMNPRRVMRDSHTTG